MYKSIFDSYNLQREELLARIAQKLELNETRKKRMESSYEAISNLLKNDELFFNGEDVELYAQGSVRIGTTVKPINGDDFDLDAVLHIYDLYHKYSPDYIFNELKQAFLRDSYYSSIMEVKKRCIRLNYKSDFHIDILPACMPNTFDKENIKIPEKKLHGWSDGNPKGFANWFINVGNSQPEYLLKSYSEIFLKANVDNEPLPKDTYLKTPLQRAVQLIKRYRDIYFKDKDNKVSSIVITTLTAQHYRQETSIYETVDNVLFRIKSSYQHSLRYGDRFKVLNPVNSDEDFTDFWTSEHYSNFYEFIESLYKNWQKIKESFEHGKNEYKILFGENIYKDSLQAQLKVHSSTSKSNLIKSTGILLTGSAHTDVKGNITMGDGIKNRPHRNYGE